MIASACAVLFLALTLALQASSVAQSQFEPFTVGVWGQGDAIIPFADFDGKRWRSSWPSPVDSDPDSTPLQRVPAAWWGRSTFQPTWELIEPNGRRLGIQITGTGPAGLGSGCARNLGLTTTASENRYQYGAVMASSRARVVESIDVLTPNAAAWRSIAASVLSIHQRHHHRGTSTEVSDVRPNGTSAVSRPRLDAAFMSKDESGEYAYFESSRDFGQHHGLSVITGWLWRRSSAMPFQLISVESGTRDADGKGLDSFHPLGVVRHGSRRFWLGSLSSYAYSGLTVADVRRAGIKQVLLVDYAGC